MFKIVLKEVLDLDNFEAVFEYFKDNNIIFASIVSLNEDDLNIFFTNELIYFHILLDNIDDEED
jgi:hypothetical protein